MNNYKISFNSNNLLFCIFIYFTYIFSNSLFIILNTSSLRSGLIFSFFLLVIIILINKRSISANINAKYLSTVNILTLIICIQFLISIILFSNQQFIRTIGSLILLYVTFLLIPLMVNYMYIIGDDIFDKVIINSYKILLFILYFSILLQKFGIIEGKEMILFKEPSHFIIVYMPILLYNVYNSSNKSRFIILTINIIGFLLIENLTAFIGVAIIILVLLWKDKKLLLVPIIILLLIFLLEGEGLSYYTSRLNMSIESNNVSVLVWISGWERALSSLIASYGVGIGFQRMGFIEELGHAQNKIYKISGGSYANLNDGGFLASKLISEVGILGILLIFVYIIYFIKILNYLKSNFEKTKIDYFFSFIYIMYIIQLFVRGVGYFSSASLYFICAIYWIFINNLKKQRQVR